MFDRITQAILNYIQKKSGKQGILDADATGLRFVDGAATRWSVSWDHVQRVTALRYPGFVGDTITLAIECGGESQIISEEQNGWSEVVAALPTYLPGAQLHEEWALALIAGGAEATVTVFDRA